jgi:hypothetical protein
VILGNSGVFRRARPFRDCALHYHMQPRTVAAGLSSSSRARARALALSCFPTKLINFLFPWLQDPQLLEPFLGAVLNPP